MHATRIAVASAAALIATLPCPATVVGLSTIEQPVNLGAEADPSRIPLGPVATESNYHYGRGPVITAARPSLHGVMRWKGGVELNQNLASVFGIEVDNHDLPHSPAVITLKNQPKPAYSPYTREQVLAATIHCLLRSNTGSPKQPIQLKVVAEAEPDQQLATKYSGDYINAPDAPESPPVDHTEVGNTRLETDATGVTWVVFPGVKPAKTPPRPPVFIPFSFKGEAAPDNPTWQLLPVWTGTDFTRESSLEIPGRPYPLFYDCFQPGTGDGPETNALFAGSQRGGVAGFDISFEDRSIHARLTHPSADAETLAAVILALVVGASPTTEAPLEVEILTYASNSQPWVEAFSKCPGWIRNDPAENQPLGFRYRFIWDAATHKLVEGAVPAAEVVKTTNGPLFIEIPRMPEEKPDPPAETNAGDEPVKSE